MLLKFEDKPEGTALLGEIELEGPKQKFNPMESWMNAGSILDTTHPALMNPFDKRRLLSTERPSDASGEAQGQGGYPNPFDQRRLNTGPQSLPGEMNGPGMIPPAVHPNPFDPSRLQGPQGDVSGAAFNNPHLGLDPYVSAGMGYQPMEHPPVDVPQGPPPGQPLADPTAGSNPTYDTPAGQGFNPMEGPPVNQVGDWDSEVSNGVSKVEQDWIRTMEQAEVPPATQAQANATIATSAKQNDGSSTVGGSPAADDPAMQRLWGDLSYDPTKRKEQYTKRMNTIFLQSMLLDVAAKAMGVESRAGAFMDHQMAVLEGEMKFDDQERLYRITQGVFYPNGVYDAPQTQREAFERAMALGATAEEAAAISGYMPDDPDFGFDTYYQANADGSVETIYVPKGSAPPQGATDASGIATHNADINNPQPTGAVPTALQVEAQVNAWNREADELEKAGNTQAALELRARADNLLALGGGASTRNEYSYAQANSTFNSVYGGMMRDSGSMGPTRDNTMYDSNNNPIPWGVYRQNWLTAWDIDVTGRDGVVRKEPGWIQISSGEKVEALPTEQRIASESDIMKLREVYSEGGARAEKAVSDFVEWFGANQLPQEFRP